MNDSPLLNKVRWGIAGGILGVVAALVIGLGAVGLAPDNGVADLAAAAVTKLMLIPLGAVFGAYLAYRSQT